MSRVVAVGRFDGVHCGHQHLLREAHRCAEGLPVVAYTFPPRGPSLLTLRAKEHLLRRYADEVVVRPWESIQGLSPEAFLREELVEGLRAAVVVVGPDHRFGRERTGSLDTLYRFGPSHGVAVHAVDPLERGGQIVSAGRIRDLIAQGDVDEAALLLGRPAWVAGTPTPGVKLARRLGYPTVNLNLYPELVLPLAGVYVAWVQWNSGEGKALFYIGDRPTFPELPPSAEVHLLVSPDGAVQGPVEVHLVGFIRPDLRFSGQEALVQQIGRDRALGEGMLEGTPSPSRLLGQEELHSPGAGP